MSKGPIADLIRDLRAQQGRDITVFFADNTVGQVARVGTMWRDLEHTLSLGQVRRIEAAKDGTLTFARDIGGPGTVAPVMAPAAPTLGLPARENQGAIAPPSSNVVQFPGLPGGQALPMLSADKQPEILQVLSILHAMNAQAEDRILRMQQVQIRELGGMFLATMEQQRAMVEAAQDIIETQGDIIQRLTERNADLEANTEPAAPAEGGPIAQVVVAALKTGLEDLGKRITDERGKKTA